MVTSHQPALRPYTDWLIESLLEAKAVAGFPPILSVYSRKSLLLCIDAFGLSVFLPYGAVPHFVYGGNSSPSVSAGGGLHGITRDH